ncbi:unnamed protein product [Fraxinus pennsylvanica]|uniref:BZIP domain-containing protein n=1 Tax=Fraxinus pennsylvanica TaxID=56036 RepID=A0AAD2EFC6_9LAMI|nr:unnamed protein product [Fraxinus pennsylvanica]
MGIQTTNSHVMVGGQQSHVQQPMARQNSWYRLTLDEVENQLGDLGKPLGSMNLDELLKNVWMAEASHSSGMDPTTAFPAASLQRQASLSLARTFRGKTVDEVWKDIQQGQKTRYTKEMITHQREPTLGETTLEDFLVRAGLLVADASQGPAMGLDSTLTPQSFTPQMGLSPSPSIDALSDTPIPGQKRFTGDLDKTLERRLRRKIKNRESAARSRARKQAYHNELMSKVSCLEEENMKLKKEKEWAKTVYCNFDEPRYQLRRTKESHQRLSPPPQNPKLSLRSLLSRPVPINLNVERLLTRTTTTRGDPPLKKLQKKFTSFALEIEREADNHSDCERLAKAFLQEMNTFEIPLLKSKAVIDANIREKENFNELKDEINKQILQAQADIEDLKKQLEESKTERHHKEECEAIRKLIAMQPPRSETQKIITDLEKEIAMLEAENTAGSRTLELRKKQFALLLHVVDELQNNIEEEQRNLMEEMRMSFDENRTGVEDTAGGPQAMALD